MIFRTSGGKWKKGVSESQLAIPTATDGGVFGILGGPEGCQCDPCCLFGGGAVNGPEIGGYCFAVFPIDVFKAVTHSRQVSAQTNYIQRFI